MLDFDNDYILENERVRLTPLKKSDVDLLMTYAVNEPDLWKYSLVQAGSPEKMVQYIQLALEGREKHHSYPFIVFDKKSGQFAGSTRFYDIQPEQATLQLGYTWYGKEFQGTGLNKNCKFLLLEFAFDGLQMERVEFRADHQNQRSIRAMKSIGCTEEGVLRSNTRKHDGTRRDSIILSILKDEWQSTIKKRLWERLG